jgi:hypothetical protein
MFKALRRASRNLDATVEALRQLVAGSANQTDLLNRKLDEVTAGSAHQTGLLNGKLDEVIAGSANQTDLLDRKLDGVIAGSANQTDLLNRKLGEVIAGSANQTDLLNRKLGEVIAGSANQTGLLNRKLEEVIAGSANQTDLLNRKLDEVIASLDFRGLLRVLISSAGRPSDSPPTGPGVVKPAMRDETMTRRLKVICVGTGRDGTSSLAQMIAKMSPPEVVGYAVGHEYKSREMFDNFCEYQETGDKKYIDALHDEIRHCPYECIVGTGYAALLSIFAEIYGQDLKLVHLRRADRTRCVESLKENSELFPAAYGNYSSSTEGRFKRMAAFHFDEMAREKWDSLSLDDKFYWYYDKTHSLVDAYRERFGAYLPIITESMNDEPTRRALAKLILDDDRVLPPPVVSNSHFVKAGVLPSPRAEVAQWMLQQMNILELGTDDVYLLEYAISRVLQFMGSSIDSEISQSLDPNSTRRCELAQSIVRANRALLSGFDQFAQMRDRLK